MFNYKKVSTNDTNGYFFDSTTYLPYHNYLTSSTHSNYPDTDIKKVDDGFVVQIDVPGYNKDDINVSYENDVLSVSGTINEEETKEDAKYFVKERRMKSFDKKWILKDTTSKGITAKCENGVLTIKVPLKEISDKTENKIKIE